MRALITGVGGFVGPYLAQLLEEHSIEVHGLAREALAGGRVHVADILDTGAVLSAVRQSRPDLIFHLAAQSSVEQSWKLPDLTHRVNVDGTRNLLDAVVKEGLSPRILIVSSAEVYGPRGTTPVTEESGERPNNPYAESRVEQERLALAYGREHGLCIIIARSFPHTGPGQGPSFVCPDFARQIMQIEKGIAHELHVGNLTPVRDFSDVRDVVQAYYAVLLKGRCGEIYNVSSGRGRSIQSVLDSLLSLSGAHPGIVVDQGKLRPSDIPVLIGDNTKLVKATGWKPQIPFEETLRDILNYWRSQP